MSLSKETCAFVTGLIAPAPLHGAAQLVVVTVRSLVDFRVRLRQLRHHGRADLGGEALGVLTDGNARHSYGECHGEHPNKMLTHRK